MDAKIKIKGVPAFIVKLWEILHEESYKQWVRWTPSQDAFFVLDQEGFSENVLAKYFRHSNFSSFTRQLNIYNFQKEKNVENITVYTHFLFKKNRISLLKGMKRKPTKEDIEKAQEMINTFDSIEQIDPSYGTREKKNESKQTNSQIDADLMKENQRLKLQNAKLLQTSNKLEAKIDGIRGKLFKYYSANSDSPFFANLFYSIINHIDSNYIYDLSSYRIFTAPQSESQSALKSQESSIYKGHQI